MLRKPVQEKRRHSPESPQWISSLLDASRAVVRAHHLRDRDIASDDDVSDAIARLEGSLPRICKATRRRT